MESWIRSKFSGNLEAVVNIMKMLYDDEFDEEEGGLREL
jgi:hypothetical protein